MSGGASGNNALDTISAAATAISSADNPVPQARTVRKRRWWSRWSIYLCFGSQKHGKRIGHAAHVPEPAAPAANSPAPGYPARASAIALPFVAPPSSPVSFLQSEPPSATQSPVGVVSFSPIPSNTYYSPCGRPSIFAIGPYAHETQLVSPPVFSTYTTEPSTAPFTPPESIHLTTPSSPEVPFAQLFNPRLQGADVVGQRSPMCDNYEFRFYQLPPGSPLGQLISPNSAVSGSGPTSPFPDGEIAVGNPRFPQFPLSEPPKLLSPEKLSSLHGSKTPTTPSKGYNQKQQPTLDIIKLHDSRVSADHGASLDLNPEHVIRCVEEKLRTTLMEASADPNHQVVVVDDDDDTRKHSNKATANPSAAEALADGKEATNRIEHHHSISLGCIKEFNFSSDSPATDKLLTNEDRVQKNNWSFFPVMQPGIIS